MDIDAVTAKQLDALGDEVATLEGYNHFKGTEALRFYLMQKHDWHVNYVRQLSHQDIAYALIEEFYPRLFDRTVTRMQLRSCIK